MAASQVTIFNGLLTGTAQQFKDALLPEAKYHQGKSWFEDLAKFEKKWLTRFKMDESTFIKSVNKSVKKDKVKGFDSKLVDLTALKVLVGNDEVVDEDEDEPIIKAPARVSDSGRRSYSTAKSKSKPKTDVDELTERRDAVIKRISKRFNNDEIELKFYRSRATGISWCHELFPLCCYAAEAVAKAYVVSTKDKTKANEEMDVVEAAVKGALKLYDNERMDDYYDLVHTLWEKS